MTDKYIVFSRERQPFIPGVKYRVARETPSVYQCQGVEISKSSEHGYQVGLIHGEDAFHKRICPH